MLDSLIQILNMVFQSVVGWFDDLITATGMGSFFMSMITIMLAYKFLLAPIFGSGRGSDTAAKSKRDKASADKG